MGADGADEPGVNGRVALRGRKRLTEIRCAAPACFDTKSKLFVLILLL